MFDEKMLYASVKTEDAPEGALITREALEAHLESGAELYEVFCGRWMQNSKYDPDWKIVDGFLFANAKDADNPDCIIGIGSIRDRHIDTHGYNDNWFFSDKGLAEAYIASRADVVAAL